MAWRINKMVIENFKFFLEPFSIEPNGKHVLMYGENGSGKSSIYWAAYTLFQSCLKNPEDAGKYFNKNHSDCLVNLYDTANRRSGIEIEFINPAGVKKSYTDGSWAPNVEYKAASSKITDAYVLVLLDVSRSFTVLNDAKFQILEIMKSITTNN